ncbi:gag-pol fusion, partial [Brachionus plicatilis]
FGNFISPTLFAKREASLKALEALRNTDDTQFIASDDDDADFLDDHNFLDEFDEVDADIDEDSKERNIKFPLKKKWMIQANMSLIRLKVQSIGEYPTKYPCVEPIISKTTKEIADNLWKFKCLFGPPKVILSDQGTDFSNTFVDNLINRIGAEHVITSKSITQTNGQD